MSERSLEKKQYRIPCSWECFGTLYIEAESLEEAKRIAEEESLLPWEQGYVDSSFRIEEDVLEMYLEEDSLLETVCDEEVIE